MTEEPTEQARKPRKRVRRNYQAELMAVEARIDTALTILSNVEGQPADVKLLKVVRDLLTGEES